MKFRRHAHNLIRRDVPKAILTTTSPPERDHRRFSLSRLRATCHEGPTGVAVAAATLGCAAPGCWPRGSAARDRHGRPPAPVPTPAATLASARAAASVSLPSSSPTSGDAVSVVPLHHSEVSGASPAAPSHLSTHSRLCRAGVRGTATEKAAAAAEGRNATWIQYPNSQPCPPSGERDAREANDVSRCAAPGGDACQTSAYTSRSRTKEGRETALSRAQK